MARCSPLSADRRVDSRVYGSAAGPEWCQRTRWPLGTSPGRGEHQARHLTAQRNTVTRRHGTGRNVGTGANVGSPRTFRQRHELPIRRTRQGKSPRRASSYPVGRPMPSAQLREVTKARERITRRQQTGKRSDQPAKMVEGQKVMGWRDVVTAVENYQPVTAPLTVQNGRPKEMIQIVYTSEFTSSPPPAGSPVAALGPTPGTLGVWCVLGCYRSRAPCRSLSLVWWCRRWSAGMISARVSRRGWRAVPRSAAPAGGAVSAFLTGVRLRPG